MLGIQRETFMAIQSTAIRFAINGFIATAAHYLTLVILLEIVELSSAGLANGLAAIVGISVSYLGNRSYVFKSDEPHTLTLPRFLSVYVGVAFYHAGFLAFWTDLFGYSYQLGFLVATGISIVLTFLGNKLFVFRTC